MIAISESEVIKQVRINLDEIGANDADFSADLDESELETIIAQKMKEAYNFVVRNAKPELVDSEMLTMLSTEMPDTKDGKVSVSVDKLIRFVFANEKDWKYPVFQPIYWNTSEYATLLDPHTTGTPERPKVGIHPDFFSPDEKKTIIDLYGCNSAGVVGLVCEPNEGEDVQLTDTLYTAYLYYITSLVLLTLRESQHAENMLGQALGLMGVDTNKS